jgi:branched-chain amino acid transport system substrate-binding protein
MKLQKLLFASALACTLALPAFAQQGVSEKEILIGGFGPTTGPLNWLGQGGRDGMILAIDEINEKGGINGRKVRLLHQGALTPAESIAAAKKLHEQDKVYAIVVGSGSTGAEAAADYLRDAGVPALNTLAVTTKIREPFAKNIFHGTTPSVLTLNAAYFRAIQAMKPKKVALLAGSYAFPQAELRATQPLIEKAGIEITTVQTYDLGDKDYTAQLVAIARTKPDVIVFFGQYQECALALKQAPEKGLGRTPWFVGGGNVTRALPRVAGKAAEGVRSVWIAPQFHGEGGMMGEFEARWAKRFGAPPEGRPAYSDIYAYGDMYILALAIKKAGNDLSWPNLIKSWESLKNAKPSDFGPGALDIILPHTYGENDHQGNDEVVPIVVKNGTFVTTR